MEALVTVEELADRLPFVMDADDEREATGALEDLSDDARYYGSDSWVDALTTPRQVRNLVLRAAVRHMKNYEGFIQSRAGDETLVWTDRGEDAGSAYFTRREQNALRQMAGKGGGLGSFDTTAWGTSEHHRHVGRRYSRHERALPMPGPIEGLVPDGTGGMVPYYSCDDSPW